ncbi:hypothetical protein AB0H00_19025 [Nocardia sp. NPDC023852]|uniref:hypothetical protein n=1 Tax=Nocardia sp. NPDC023852 TaxID=3154697 RepID=UPI0033DB295E
MTDESATTTDDESSAAVRTEEAKRPVSSVIPRALVAALVALTALAGFLGWRWYTTEQDLDALRRDVDDRDKAAAVAADYAKRSLTYDFRNLDAFFDSVRHGTTDRLSHRYDTVHDTLSKIMTEAQVVAHGDVVGTAIGSVDGDDYTVTVFATQQTQNVQHPEPVSAATLLTVNVHRDGGNWVVADYRSQ